MLLLRLEFYASLLGKERQCYADVIMLSVCDLQYVLRLGWRKYPKVRLFPPLLLYTSFALYADKNFTYL